MFLRLKNSVILLSALVLFSPLDSFFNSHFIVGASAESEASSEAANEAPMTGGRRRRGYWRNQMQQQQRQGGQQARRQQPGQGLGQGLGQGQGQQQRRRFGAGQAAKPFKVSDYIHEYGSGRSKGNFNRQNLSAANSNGAGGLFSAAGQAGSGGSSSATLPSASSVPFQKFPPK